MHDIQITPKMRTYNNYDIPPAPLYESEIQKEMSFMHDNYDIPAAPLYESEIQKEMNKSRITAAAFFKVKAFKNDRDILIEYLTGWLSSDSSKNLSFLPHMQTVSNKPYVSIGIVDRINKNEVLGREEKWDTIWQGLPQKYKDIIQLIIYRVVNGKADKQVLNYGRDDEMRQNETTKKWERANIKKWYKYKN